MTVKIGSNISSLTAQRLLSAATGKVSTIAERLSSGQRINKASDDAAGLAISMSLNTASRILGQGIRNINDTLSVASVSSAAMGQLEQITVRQRELAEQSANGIYSSKQRLAMEAEAKALTNEYNRIILTTKFNGQQLLSQPWEELRTQTGVGVENSIAFKFADELATKVTPGSYFTLNTPEQSFYVWYTVDGVGTDPHAEGTGIQVDLYSQSTAGTASTAATAGFFDFSAVDGSQISSGDYFYVSSPSKSYYVWFNVDGAGGNPLDPDQRGATGLEVNISSSDLREVVADNVLAALENTGRFTGDNNFGDSSIFNTTVGAVLFDAYNGAGSSGISQQNSGSNFIAGTAKSQTITATQVRDAVAAKLALVDAFSTQVAADGSLMVTNLDKGRAVDIVDYNSGNVLIDTATEGTGLSFIDFGNPGSAAATDMRSIDLNGDGALDLATVNNGSNSVSIRLNDGLGEFGAAITYAVGSGPQAIEFADLNGDGKLDFVTNDNGAGRVSVRFGVGDGTFGVRTSYTVAASGYSLALGDINRDGRTDIVTSAVGGTVNILLNQGGGTFGAATTIAALGEIIKLGDLNNDGKLDIVATSYNSSNATVKLGNGNGTFGSSTNYAMGGSGVNAIVLKDVNGDGWLDLGATNIFISSASVLINNHAGGFSAPNVYSAGHDTAGIAFADINHDGKQDLITGDYTTNIVTTQFGNGDGTFGAGSSHYIGGPISSYNGIYKLQTADIDGDGNVDIIANDTGNSRLAVLWGSATGIEAKRAEVTRLGFGDSRGMTLINQIDLSTKQGALKAISTLENRLTRIHQQVGAMGAVTARLDTALKVTAASQDNFTAAESRIKDADIAQEAGDYARNQILQKVAQSVLAQANLIPELALKLLRS